MTGRNLETSEPISSISSVTSESLSHIFSASFFFFCTNKRRTLLKATCHLVFKSLSHCLFLRDVLLQNRPGWVRHLPAVCSCVSPDKRRETRRGKTETELWPGRRLCTSSQHRFKNQVKQRQLAVSIGISISMSSRKPKEENQERIPEECRLRSKAALVPVFTALFRRTDLC